MISFILLLIVAGICGSLGAALVGGDKRPTGCLVSIALGFIGALLGQWIAQKMHLPDIFVVQLSGQSIPLIWSIIGSALFVAVLSLFRRRSA